MQEAVATYIRDQAAAFCQSSRVPGYLAGVYHDGGIMHGVYGDSAKGLTIGQLAEYAGVTVKAVRHYRRRRDDSDLDVIAHITKAPSDDERLHEHGCARHG